MCIKTKILSYYILFLLLCGINNNVFSKDNKVKLNGGYSNKEIIKDVENFLNGLSDSESLKKYFLEDEEYDNMIGGLLAKSGFNGKNLAKPSNIKLSAQSSMDLFNKHYEKGFVMELKKKKKDRENDHTLIGYTYLLQPKSGSEFLPRKFRVYLVKTGVLNRYKLISLTFNS